MGEPARTVRNIASNRRVRHDYHVLEELECGIVLTGTEVKSLRQGRASLAEAFALIRAGELFLVGAHIPEYAHGNIQNHVPVHDRKLLAHKREVERLYKRVREKGLTLVPLELYFNGARVKVKIALVRGKRQHDKRAVTKERDARREIDRAMSRRR
jgi:SsrA-binding protein